MTVLTKRDNPRISMMMARATDSSLNDEGETLMTSLKLETDSEPSAFQTHGYTASINCTPDPTVACSLNVSIADMFIGVINSTEAITGAFSNGFDYKVTLTISNGYETATAMQDISRAFANVHLSGHPTGGVCFGGFSSSQFGVPKFECYFPAYFYGGVNGEGTGFNDGDSITLKSGFFDGYVSNSKKDIFFKVPIFKSLDGINSVTCEKLQAHIANSGGYGITSSVKDGGSDYTSLVKSISIERISNMLVVKINRSTAFNFTNNACLQCRVVEITLTFHA